MAKKKKTITNGNFEIKLENSKILKTLVETLSGIYDEVKFEFDESGVFTNLMDPSRICLARVVLKQVCFEEYNVPNSTTVSINLDDFNKVLKRSNNDVIEITHDPKALKLILKFTQPGKERGRTFRLTELDIEIEDVEMGALLGKQYSTKLGIDPDQLNNALKDADIYSEIIGIEVNEQFELKASGPLGEYEFEADLSELIGSQVEEYCSGAYSIPFLKNILKLIPITEKLELSIKSEHPLKLVFNLIEGGKVYYFLAPRASEEDFNDDDDMEDF